MKNRIENSIRLDESSIWVLTERKEFNYSDGIASERYLEKVFSQTNDLSSYSLELEKWIKDWPSEYHLSRKRSQLLRSFDFDRSKKVLEVGCGCGAITRFLGERFDDVVSIEGSFPRARLARLRTRDMDNISVLCAPFQEIRFKAPFDIIFCIGVFEYSGSFVNGDDPYDLILKYFHNILSEDGIIVLAIENQFGLKYFSSSKEDHTNIMFEGIEGYSHDRKKARTFGYDELKAKLNKYFSNIDFYFPYPDYKIPACILSENFLNKVKAGELVGNFESCDYLNNQKSLFDVKLACLELDKNNKLPFFSNSFLVIAGKKAIQSIRPNALGVLYTTNRSEKFQTITKFMEGPDKSIWAEKTPSSGSTRIESKLLTLNATRSKWHSGLSLQSLIAQRVKERDITPDELFFPCRSWLSALKGVGVRENDKFFLDGKYVDCLWRNSYIDNDECIFIDQEWAWHCKININVLVLRSIYWFLKDISNMPDLNSNLKKKRTKILIKQIAKTLDVELTNADFDEFYKLESNICRIVFGFNSLRNWFYIRLPLWNKSIYFLLLHIGKPIQKGIKKIKMGFYNG